MKVKLSDRAQAQLKITVFIILFGTGAIVVVIGLGIFVSALFGIVVGLVFLIRYGMYVPYKDKAKLPTAIGIWIYSIIIILISFRLYGNWPQIPIRVNSAISCFL